MSKPIVAIVGRPNVGKSTLFNQIGKRRVSIVDDMPGVTRDRIYMDAEWLNHTFTMIDTGGIEFDESDQILRSMRQQAKIAMEEADVIVFVVDGRVAILVNTLYVGHFDVANGHDGIANGEAEVLQAQVVTIVALGHYDLYLVLLSGFAVDDDLEVRTVGGGTQCHSAACCCRRRCSPGSRRRSCRWR